MKILILILVTAAVLHPSGMTLEDCIRTAESNNFDVSISDLSRDVSKYGVRDARNRFFDITAGGSYFVNGDDSENYNSSLSASAGVTGRLSMNHLTAYRSSVLSERSAGIEYEQALSSLRHSVINSFFQVLIAEERLRLQQNIAEYSQKKFEEAELRFSMGNISRSDLLSFDVSRSSDIIDLKSAESNLKRARQSLIYLMNIQKDPDSLIITFSGYEYDPAEQFDPEIVIGEALGNRNDIALSEIGIRQREFSLRSEYGNYLPSLTGSVTYEYNKFTDFQHDWRSYTTDGIKARMGLSVNLTHSGLNVIDRSKVELKRSRIALENRKSSVENEVRLKLLELENQKNNYILAEKHVELARENLDLAEKLFNLGDRSVSDFMQARNSYISAEYRKISSYYNLILSRYDLLNSLGRTF